MRCGTLLVCGSLLGVVGCMTSSPPVRSWTIESNGPATAPAVEGRAPAFPATRLGSVVVDAPFDRPSMAVRRSDGTLAFDARNEFAATPAALLRAPVKAQLTADGRFGHVVGNTSLAGTDAAVETTVTDLSLDCREAGRRTARVAVNLDVIKTGRGPRRVELSGSGTGTADAAAGDYGEAFSAAFDAAFKDALKSLK